MEQKLKEYKLFYENDLNNYKNDFTLSKEKFENESQINLYQINQLNEK